MGKITNPWPVKLIIGFIFREEELFNKARKVLAGRFGPVDFESSPLPFVFTDYYKDEMGEGLKKVFLSFKKLILPQNLSGIKLFTNRLENKFAQGKKRRINIDPGYLELPKLVLASTKDYSHRIYLKDGIYAEITLFFKNNSYEPWQWTYPDYRTQQYLHIFNHIRQIYAGQIKNI